jgi:hypothetical protein
LIPAQNGAAEFQAGKSASAAELRFRLSAAAAGYLQGAFQNPAFGEEHLAPIFSNPALPAGLIQQIAGNKQWLSRPEIRRAIVFHRNSPRPLRLNLIHFLGWKDLAKAMEDPFVPPPVKKAAETLLKARVEEMALGEKIALARMAGPGVIPSLRSEGHGEVIAALLGNPRLTEAEVLLICSAEQATPAVLAAVGSQPKWRQRYPVKMELLRNPRTPAAVTLGFLDSLSTSDLGEIASQAGVPRLVRATAKQILESRRDSVDTSGAVS